MNIFAEPLAALTATARRKIYGLKRRVVPACRRRHRLETMIGPVGYWPQLQAYQFGFLIKMGLLPRHAVCEIGCGPLPGGLPLIDYLQPGNYAGVDISVAAIEEAHREVARARLAHKNPLLVVSQTCGAHELGERSFDYIFASQVLYHLPPAALAALWPQVAQRLRPSGVFYGDILGFPNNVTRSCRWQGFPFHQHNLAHLQQEARAHGLAVEVIGQVGDFGYPINIDLQRNQMLAVRLATRGSSAVV